MNQGPKTYGFQKLKCEIEKIGQTNASMKSVENP